MSKDDGGPAFPILNVHQPWDHDEHTYEGVTTTVQASGMSLRDWFAGQVMLRLIQVESFKEGESSLRIDTARCYRVADAMLAERKK